MPYTVGDTIEASTYNAFASQSNKLMVVGSGDFGYGQAAKSLDDAVAVGTSVTSAQGKALRDNIDDFNDHQATVPAVAVPASTDFEVGDPILAYDGSGGRWDLASNLGTDNLDNRLNADAGQLQVAGSVHATGTHKRNTDWNTQVQHEFTATFASNDAARHFFNTGGRIEISHAMDGISGSQAEKEGDWQSIISRAGTYVFDASVYYNGNAVGGSAAVASTLRQTTVGSATAYTTNDLSIFERRDAVDSSLGSQGRIITFTVNYNDDSAGNPDEQVSACLTNIIDHVFSTGVILGTVPVYATVISMSAGS